MHFKIEDTLFIRTQPGNTGIANMDAVPGNIRHTENAAG